MSNHNIVEKTPLLTEFLNLLTSHRPLYSQQRIFNRVLGLSMAELFSFGRHTITQLLSSLGLTEEDWSSWYRLFSKGRFDEKGSSGVMVREILKEVGEKELFVVGGDGFHVPRSSQKIPGTGWMRGMNTAKFKPGIEPGQRFFEGSWLPQMVNGYSRAIPIRCLSAFVEKAVESRDGARTEVKACLTFLHDLRRHLDEAGRSEQWLMSLNDGGYDTLDYWGNLPSKTIGAVRTARNRCLFYLPPKEAHGNCRYGEKLPAPHTFVKKPRKLHRLEVVVRGQKRTIAHRVEGPVVRDGLSEVPLFLIIIGGGKRPKGARRKRYEPCYFLVSAVWQDDQWVLPLPLGELLAWLWQRWELEVAHRQLKTGLGLGEKQCWHPVATVATVQWSAWLYALLLLTGHRVWGHQTPQKPPGLWRKPPQRWSFATLLSALRAEMWPLPEFQASWIWSRNNWFEKAALHSSMVNSVLASSRL